MQIVISTLLILSGLAIGAGLGLALRPIDSPAEAALSSEPTPDLTANDATPDFVKLSRQIIIPVVEGGETRALMLFEIALDMRPGMSDRVFAIEPRLRDAFLRDLFELSHSGAFVDTYTDTQLMDELRRKLRESARHLLGSDVSDVLLLEVLRQEY